MERLKYMQLLRGDAQHIRLLAELLTDYNREIAPEWTERSAELAVRLIGETGASGSHLEIVFAPQESGGQSVAGFVWGQIDSAGRGFVREFYVKPEYRRRGYGSDIFRHLESCFARDGAAEAWLTAGDSAREFWESVGFVKTGVTADFNGLPVYTKR
ncbi:MAG: GNAT family N-acetyltransferase [Oscillospiraceae bacterium]|jgi:GNAT superfamily N-acetyltransferase|nr:GNAT family N-acetyltransferase [Oscillospiraceae bacterium]